MQQQNGELQHHPLMKLEAKTASCLEEQVLPSTENQKAELGRKQNECRRNVEETENGQKPWSQERPDEKGAQEKIMCTDKSLGEL
ncbi:hypothetical protein AVEN_256374-1 [Araneus ventricosus]|uniref:Uncharacterized protein n=1 Tax=Araneus ventricosus TaxID=182803 RepID=A0A4Y2KSR1_ARAVE|nr:hypothetical protein AVEN_256374-1 [Araneus ventricosus]